MVDKARYVTIVGSVVYAPTESTNPIERCGATLTHPAGRGALKRTRRFWPKRTQRENVIAIQRATFPSVAPDCAPKHRFLRNEPNEGFHNDFKCRQESNLICS